MIEPITPGQVHKKIPEDIIKIFNELINENWNGNESIIRQTDAVDKITAETLYTTDELFDKNLLDVEDTYRKAGWKVKYEKPDYTENFKAFWRFTKS
jgi:hypothetical protein